MTLLRWLFVLLLIVTPALAQQEMHGIARYGTPKYPPNFQYFDYVNPDAPKGGELRLGSIGSYDTLNPFTIKGVSAEGADMVFETLMVRSMDEPFTEYGLIAESATIAPDKSWVTFKLRPEARFHDGTPITPDDVVFSFETLRDKAVPYFSSYYKGVVKVETLNNNSVKFVFHDGTNAELPYVMGQLPIFSRKFWQGKDFAATTLEPILGSGPYRIGSFTPGRTIVYERVKDYWGKDLPVNRGQYNYDQIRYDYYREPTVEMEGFFAGRYDFRLENSAKNWATEYNTPAIKNNLIKLDQIKNELPAGMQAFIMNTRRDVFKDRRVRLALNYAFDFEWASKNVAYGAYQRTTSYFENSELASRGLPSEAELKILEPYRGKIPDEVFKEEFKLPMTDGSGDNRENLHKATQLLHEAGWNLKNGVLVNAENKPFTFEIIEYEPIFERWIQPYLRNLERLGIKVSYRVIDVSQYQNRMNNFDFDMTTHVFGQPLAPGNEQFDYWSTSKADVVGSQNFLGVRDPVVDQLLDKLARVNSREELTTICHALDRVLLWNYYVIPNWHIGSYRIAYWDMFGHPKINPQYGLVVGNAWWIDKAKAEKIISAQQRNR